MNIEALFQDHRSELVNYLAGIVRCPETAADIVQETFIVLAREARRQTIEHPRGFLFRVAGNMAFDYLKHKKVTEKYAQSQDPAIVGQTETPSAERLAADAESLDILAEAIEQLPPRCREAFVLHKIHGLSYKEIAKELEISESGVEKHIMKGLLHCRRQLKSLIRE